MSAENIKTKLDVFSLNKHGELQNAYTPLQNLINESTSQIGDFQSSKLKFNKNTPVDILVTDEYDGSVNLVLNDDKNNPKLINTRFSVQENNTFEVPIHSGNKVLNIYNESTLNQDVLLLRLYDSIPKVTFLGLLEGGSFKCGSYVFYFKLADADGNLSNTVQESGIVQVHIGNSNTAKIRMGMLDEDSKKCIKFELTNVDNSFDYIRIFYERASTDDSQAITRSFYMIDLNYPIKNGKCEILLTGNESQLQIDKSDLQNEFADIQTAKTQTVVDNTLFLGNISAYELDYAQLQLIAWRIMPSIYYDKDLGSIDGNDYSFTGGYSYYDMKNVYNKTGYWNDELYRFGVVFIYNNNLLSPVFNIQGCDLGQELTIGDYYEKEYAATVNNELITLADCRRFDSDNGFFNQDKFINSKGVVRLKGNQAQFKSLNRGSISYTPMGVKFDLRYIGATTICKNSSGNYVPYKYTDPLTLLKSLNIKGLFFVRQKRIPTIISQGIVVGLTSKDHGSIPVLKNKKGQWITKSFLSPGRTLLSEGSTVIIKSDVVNQALLVPDYEVNQATLNQIFNGSEFLLTKIGNLQFDINTDHHYPSKFTYNQNEEVSNSIMMTGVPIETKITTDGLNYFSTRVGNPDEPYKTEDVNNVWNKTAPLLLTVSTSLIRGNWGPFVGISQNNFQYGDIVNIKLGCWKNSDLLLLEYQKRFSDYSLYSAISPRLEIDSIFKSSNSSQYNILCYRGDCFFGMFTHRMMNNFVDPELPTNTQIIDPACWAKNYGVRCTAEILKDTHSNLTSDSDGWYIPAPPLLKSGIVGLIFGILTGNIGTVINSIKQIKNAHESNESSQLKYANEIAQAFEIYIGKSSSGEGLERDGGISDDAEEAANTSVKTLVQKGWIKKVNPKEQEQSGGFNLKAIFKSDDNWELHGLASINRADVNAVSFGSWITFPILSLYNLALRDIDFSQATEETAHQKKRSFYPLQSMNIYNHLHESGVINGAAKVSIGSNQRPAYMTIPFIKQEYFNRIYWSKPNVSQLFINSYRIIFKDQYREYNKEFGAITKLISLPNQLFVVFLHGLGLLPVNRQPGNENETSPWLSSKSVLPSQVNTLTHDYGSMWKDSILQSPYTQAIYGVDTVAKKIWKYSNKLEFISDFKVLKFLNDHINLSEYDFQEWQGHINVKTHYNEFKHDVMFTYYKDIPVDSNNNEVSPSSENFDHWEKGEYWNLCYNEITDNFITFYSWIPVESCNIDNIFFSFDRDSIETSLKSVENNSIKLLYTDIIKLKETATDKIQFLQFTGIVSDKYTYGAIGSSIPTHYTSLYKDGEEVFDFSNNHYGYIINVNPELEYLNQNKYFIDKAFTNSTKVYNWRNVNSFTITTPLGVNYMSYYYRDPNNVYTNPIGTNQYFRSLQDGWNFAVLELNPNQSQTLTFTKTGSQIVYIADLRFANIEYSDLNLTDPVLQLMALRDLNPDKMYLWKHGQAGLYDNQGKIRPTYWYGKQHEWAFEFIVNEQSLIQKIFNNLLIVSNKTAPYKFEYEVIGEGYEWYNYKEVIGWINKYSEKNEISLQDAYKYVLSNTYQTLRNQNLDFPELFDFNPNLKIAKLPYLKLLFTDQHGMYYEDPDYWDGVTGNYSLNSSETILTEDQLLSEFKLHTESKGNDIKKYGRLRGNMEYLEDEWKIEIRPINFKYAYIDVNSNLNLTPKIYETRHRDKFIRIKVRYDGKDLAVIQSVNTLFDYSFA